MLDSKIKFSSRLKKKIMISKFFTYLDVAWDMRESHGMCSGPSPSPGMRTVSAGVAPLLQARNIPYVIAGITWAPLGQK